METGRSKYKNRMKSLNRFKLKTDWSKIKWLKGVFVKKKKRNETKWNEAYNFEFTNVELHNKKWFSEKLHQFLFYRKLTWCWLYLDREPKTKLNVDDRLVIVDIMNQTLLQEMRPSLLSWLSVLYLSACVIASLHQKNAMLLV